MPEDRKPQPQAAKASLVSGAAVVAVPDPEVAALQKTVAALQQQIDALKKQAGTPKVQVEGIFTGASLTVSKPVQDVIAQYEALERALLSPVPAWVFPGSAGQNSTIGAPS